MNVWRYQVRYLSKKRCFPSEKRRARFAPRTIIVFRGFLKHSLHRCSLRVQWAVSVCIEERDDVSLRFGMPARGSRIPRFKDETCLLLKLYCERAADRPLLSTFRGLNFNFDSWNFDLKIWGCWEYLSNDRLSNYILIVIYRDWNSIGFSMAERISFDLN